MRAQISNLTNVTWCLSAVRWPTLWVVGLFYLMCHQFSVIYSWKLVEASSWCVFSAKQVESLYHFQFNCGSLLLWAFEKFHRIETKTNAKFIQTINGRRLRLDVERFRAHWEVHWRRFFSSYKTTRYLFKLEECANEFNELGVKIPDLPPSSSDVSQVQKYGQSECASEMTLSINIHQSEYVMLVKNFLLQIVRSVRLKCRPFLSIQIFLTYIIFQRKKRESTWAVVC